MWFDLGDLTKEDRVALRKLGFRVKKAFDFDNDLSWKVSRIE